MRSSLGRGALSAIVQGLSGCSDLVGVLLVILRFDFFLGLVGAVRGVNWQRKVIKFFLKGLYYMFSRAVVDL